MADAGKPIIVIKKKGGHGGHHGGAWKVAYADFVTAMMAFFMVMWLVNSAEVATKKSIASYFRKPGMFEHGSGTPLMVGEAGILQDSYVPPQKLNKEQFKSGSKQDPMKKKTGSEDRLKDKEITTTKGDQEGKIVKKGETKDMTGSPGVANENTAAKEMKILKPGTELDEQVGGAKEEALKGVTKEFKSIAGTDKSGTALIADQVERQTVAQVGEEIKKEIVATKELQDLLGAVDVKLDADGLKIEVIDTERTSMFALGSAQILPDAQAAFARIARVIKKLPNRIDIVGHTDAKPFSNRRGGYSNWELSADRANAARRILENEGIPADQIARVVGRADRELKMDPDPLHYSNRRITIRIKFKTTKVVPIDQSNAAPQQAVNQVVAPAATEANETPAQEAVPVTPAPKVYETEEQRLQGEGDELIKRSTLAGKYAPKTFIKAKKSKKKTIILTDPATTSNPAPSGKDKIFGDSPVFGPTTGPL